ncbi:MAG: hypothetical protein QM626_10215 [Microbacterium sp.]|uniref:hypothetical protein n=1 Tax=Microbacterium sp. TaxID=51671 RepID=UPI0039E29A05
MSEASLAPRRVPILGIVALVLVLLAIAPSLLCFVVALQPSTADAAWFLFVTLPFTALGGILCLLLSALALVLDIRARRNLVCTILALLLSIVAVLVPVALISGWFL